MPGKRWICVSLVSAVSKHLHIANKERSYEVSEKEEKTYDNNSNLYKFQL